jgi:hypothetical protein
MRRGGIRYWRNLVEGSNTNICTRTLGVDTGMVTCCPTWGCTTKKVSVSKKEGPLVPWTSKCSEHISFRENQERNDTQSLLECSLTTRAEENAALGCSMLVGGHGMIMRCRLLDFGAGGKPGSRSR